MNPNRNILNRRAKDLLVNDVVMQPLWARGLVEAAVPTFLHDSGDIREMSVRILTSKGKEDIIFLPSYVLTVERRVVVPQLRDLEGLQDQVGPDL